MTYTKRAHTEEWLRAHRIDVMAVQETKHNANTSEGAHDYKWYYSSDIEIDKAAKVKKKRADGQRRVTPEEWREVAEHRGMGIVIHKKYGHV